MVKNRFSNRILAVTFLSVFISACSDSATDSSSSPTPEPTPTPALLWSQTHGLHYQDQARDVQQMWDGGYIVAGMTMSNGESSDGWVYKTDINGNYIWEQFLGGAGTDDIHAIAKTADGGFALAGSLEAPGTSILNGWLVKLDADGQLKGTTTFGSEFYGNFYDVESTTDGGVILAGGQTLAGHERDAWLVKADSEGREEWNATFDGGERDSFNSVIQTTDGSYLAVGTKGTNSGSGTDLWVKRVNKTGDERWEYEFSDLSFSHGNAATETIDGGIIVVGNTSMGTGVSADAVIIKLDKLGEEEWVSIVDGEGQDGAFGITPAIDGGYVVVGHTQLDGASSVHAWVTKIDEQGREVWNTTYGDDDGYCIRGVRQTLDNSYVLVGDIWSYDLMKSYGWLLKIASDGTTPPQGG